MMITGKHLRQSLFLVADQVCNFIKKETLAQVFSCEFCEISKNTFTYRIPPVAASGNCPIKFGSSFQYSFVDLSTHTNISQVNCRGNWFN